MAKTNTNDTQKGVGLHARRIIAYVVLIIISFFCLFWFYIMFINATRSNGELQSGFTAIPSTNLLKNWNNLVHGTLPIWYGMFNSLIIAACSAVLCTYFSTMTAYAIHAYDFKMKRFIYPFILMIMMIPTQVTALGFIKLITGMGLMDSFIPLIVPAWFGGGAFYIFLLRQFYLGIPKDFEEAARIDGANQFQIYWKIFMPIMKPSLILVGVLNMLTVWNDYLGPLIFLQDRSKYTLALGLASFKGVHSTQIIPMLCITIIMIIPPIIIFIIAQKYIVEGTSGSIK